ncbi:MAG: DUF711 family protein [Candidatus Acidiferrales bacterium]
MGATSRAASPADNRPKVRAITAFISLEPAHYETQIAETLAALKKIKAAYEKAGFEVQTMRITTQPFPEYTRNLSDSQALDFFKKYDDLAAKDGFDAAIGPAMLHKGDNPREARLLGQIIASTKILEGSIVIASDDGIHWDAIPAAASVIHFLGASSANGLGNFRFAAIAMVPANTPFYPASYQMNGNHTFAIGLESANVVAAALASTRDPQKAQLAIENSLGRWAREIEAIGKHAGEETGWKYAGIDLSPAPLKDISIGAAIENFTGEPMGSSGTLAAVAIITRALKNIPVTRTGYSGLMLPVLEDSVIARRWSEGRLSLDSLLLFSSVCGTGLDVIPMPGDTTEARIEPILKDVASLAYKWHKPLSARLLPVAGKKAGEQTEFQDPLMVNATIQAVR